MLTPESLVTGSSVGGMHYYEYKSVLIVRAV